MTDRPDLAELLSTSVVRIMYNGQVHGAGFLIGDHHVATCAHVLTAALTESVPTATTPTAAFSIDFPCIHNSATIAAHVVTWKPRALGGDRIPEDGEDIAILKLSTAPPPGACGARISNDVSIYDTEFLTFGFPRGYNDGAHAEGRILGVQGRGYIGLAGAEVPGHRITGGFSGAPVWSKKLEAVVGMVVTEHSTDPAMKAGEMIPVSKIIKAMPDIGALLKDSDLDLGAIEGEVVPASSSETEEIQRLNYVDAIETELASHRVVQILGRDGIGKTTLLEQFWKRSRSTTKTCVFVKLDLFTISTYQPQAIAAQVLSQLPDAFSKGVNQDHDFVASGAYAAALANFERTLGRRRTNATFIIDGLDSVPTEENELRRDILSLFPFGSSHIHFLISGDMDLPLSAGKSYRTAIVGFTQDETARYLNGFGLTSDQIETLRMTCKGSPDQLKIVRSLLRHGTPPTQLIEELPTRAPDLFDIAWRHVEKRGEPTLTILATIAYSHRPLSAKDISTISSIDIEVVRPILKTIDCIKESKDGFAFDSEAMSRFAKIKLHPHRHRIFEAIISQLSTASGSTTAAVMLPTYLQDAGRHEELIKHLSSAHIATIMDRTQSVAILQKHTSLGIAAANHLKRDSEIARFSLQRSTISEVVAGSVWRSEVAARMAIGDYNAAFHLASAARVLEVRLHLFAIIGRMQREASQEIDPAVVEQVKQLAAQVSPGDLGDQAVEIAADLVYVVPGLAIDLVERSTTATTSSPAASSPRRSTDWAFARLSVEANTQNSREVGDLLRSKISDPVAQRFSHEIKVLLGNYSPEQVIAEVQQIAMASDRLRLLRHWTLSNRLHPNATTVVSFALDMAVENAELSLTARVLSDLAAPLAHMTPNTPGTTALLSRFLTHTQTAERLGPTEDFVSLELTLASVTPADQDPTGRLVGIFLYISGIADVETKVVCIARFLATITRSDPEQLLERSEQLHSLARSLFDVCLDAVLRDSAEHGVAAKRVIGALAVSCPMLARSVAERLNTEDRRNRGALDYIQAICDSKPASHQLTSLLEAARSITDQSDMDNALEVIVRSFVDQAESVPSDHDFDLVTSMIESTENLSVKCQSAASAYGFFKRFNMHNADAILPKLRAWWASIDSGWNRVDTGFAITRAIATTNRGEARSFIKEVDAFRSSIAFGAADVADAYIKCAFLAVKSFSGLLPRKADTSDDRTRIDEVIQKIPSKSVRAQLWSELAFQYYLAGRREELVSIVSDRVHPLLELLRITDPSAATNATIHCSHSLYIYQSAASDSAFGRLDQCDSDHAYHFASLAIARRQHALDPYDDSEDYVPSMTYEAACMMLDLAQRIDLDDHVYYCILMLVNGIHAGKRATKLTGDQTSKIAAGLASLIDSKLPSPRRRSVQHLGYKILALAQLAKLKNASSGEWAALSQMVTEIPNAADRALMFTSMASIVSSGELRRELLDRSEKALLTLESIADKIGRRLWLAMGAMDINKQLAKACITEGTRLSIEFDAEDHASHRRQLVDLAYRVDPDFASSLAAANDPDPVRKNVRLSIGRRVGQLRLKNKIEKHEGDLESALSIGDSSVISAASLMHASMNAGGSSRPSLEWTRGLLARASSISLRRSFPVYRFVIDGMVKKYSNTIQARSMLRQLFDATIAVADLAQHMAERSTTWIPPIGDDETSKQVSRVDRDDQAALEGIIRDWIERSNEDVLLISEESFYPADLRLLQSIASGLNLRRIGILTGRSGLTSASGESVPEDVFRNEWASGGTTELPDDVEIVFAATEFSSSFPISQSVWILGLHGIRLSARFGSLGATESGEVAYLSPAEAATHSETMKRFFERSTKSFLGEKVRFTIYTM